MPDARSPARPGGAGPAAGQASPAGPSASPLSFPRLEGVYRQGSRSFVVNCQGWWLDLRTQQIRQLTPAGGGAFTYGPGWQVPVPVQGQLHFSTDAAGIPGRGTGAGPGRGPGNAVRAAAT